LQHGLSLAVWLDHARSTEVERLAIELSGKSADSCQLFFARLAAEAELDLCRIGQVRAERLNAVEAALNRDDPDAFGNVVSELQRLERYYGRAFARRNRALRCL
jgi:hypothetical protein